MTTATFGSVRTVASRVLIGKRLLRPLFETTEVNLISSGEPSGLHPLAPNEPGRPAAPVKIPNSFFLNADLIDGGGGDDGLTISEAKEFSSVAVVAPEDYKRLVKNEAKLRLAGRAGDAFFAWFVPEPSHIDNSMVDRLLRRGIISVPFVAAVLAIDIKMPILSEKRASLLRFVPESFTFKAVDPGAAPRTDHPDELTSAVIASIRQESPAGGSTEAEFLALLESGDPGGQLRSRVQAYLRETRNRLDDPSTRDGHLRELMERAIEVRQEVLNHPILGALNETGDRLFPIR